MKSAVALVLGFLLIVLMAGIRPASAQNSKWTFMVYLDADNNLEDVGIDNFLHMAQVGSTNDVNIVVQFDRSSSYDTSYGDWSTTKRFHVEKDMTPDAATDAIPIAQPGNPGRTTRLLRMLARTCIHSRLFAPPPVV